jgi:hypothetical protein
MNIPWESPASRPLSTAMQQLGYQKWYERELLSSHAHLVLALLSVVAMLASLEAFSGAAPEQKIINLVFAIVSGAIGLWALRRYLYLMMRAEGVATQASCRDCGTYGRFKVVGEDRDPDEAHVCCNKCAHQWTICT